MTQHPRSNKYEEGFKAGVAAAGKQEKREPLTSLDQVKAMSQDQINERWDDVQKLLIAEGQASRDDAARAAEFTA